MAFELFHALYFFKETEQSFNIYLFIYQKRLERDYIILFLLCQDNASTLLFCLLNNDNGFKSLISDYQ